MSDKKPEDYIAPPDSIQMYRYAVYLRASGSGRRKTRFVGQMRRVVWQN